MLSSLVSEWMFDEPEVNGKTKDTWGSNHGTVYGVEWVDDCVFGKCYSFNGTSNYIDCGELGSLGDEFTFSAWFKTSSKETYNPIVMIDGDKKGNPQLRTVSSGKVQFRFYNGNNLESVKIHNNNRWYFAVGGVSDGKQILYVDGISQGTLAPSATLDWSGSAKIGLYSLSASYNYFTGSIDDVRIYNTALSSAQIKQNYIVGLDSMLKKGTLSKDEYNERLQALANE